MAVFAGKAKFSLKTLPLLLSLFLQLSGAFPVHRGSPEEEPTQIVQVH